MTENLATTNKVTYWEPSAGEKIAGIIQGNGALNDLLYDEHKAMLLKDDSGAIIAVILNRYLRHSLKQNNAELGDFVTVIFHGKEKKNNGRSFNRYTLKAQQDK